MMECFCDQSYLNKICLEDFDEIDIDFSHLQKIVQKCTEPKTGGQMSNFICRNADIKKQIQLIFDIYGKTEYVLCGIYMAIDEEFGYRTKMYDLLCSALEDTEEKNIDNMLLADFLFDNVDYEKICLSQNIPIYDTPKYIFNFDKLLTLFYEYTHVCFMGIIDPKARYASEKSALWNNIYVSYIEKCKKFSYKRKSRYIIKEIDDFFEKEKDAIVKNIIKNEGERISHVYGYMVDEENVTKILDILFIARFRWGCRCNV